MQVTKKDLPKSQVELTIELSVEEVQPFVDKAAKRIAKDVDIKGFRKGKVPYDVLAKNVGEATIYEEAFNDIVEDVYPKAVEQEDLQVAGKANIDLEKIAPGNPVVFKATVPLMPNVSLGNYKKVKVKKGTAKMDDAKFEKTLKDIQKMRAKEKVVNREAKEGDKVVLDFEVKVGGVVIEGGSAQKQPLVIGESQFIPGFEEEIVGLKKDDEKDFELQFPEEYKKEVAGKKGAFHVKVHDVFEIELPELTDEIAKEMSFENLDKMKEELQKNIMRELEQKEQEKYEKEVIEAMMKEAEIDDVPEQLIEDEAEKMVQESEHEISQQGLKFDDYLEHLGKKRDELKEEFKQNAEKRIQAALVMRELAVVEDIKVDTAEIDKELEEMKKMYDQLPEMAAQFDAPQYRAHIENTMMHKKTFERIGSFSGKGDAEDKDKKAE